MNTINYLIIFFASLLVISCSKVTDPVKKIGIGSRVINYQADEKVDNLVIPPDLTAPNSQSLFSEVIELKNDEDIITKSKNVVIKRDTYRRWLEVDKSPNELWSLSKEFFRSYGFKIEKENQKIGLMETDYLEIETKVPDKSLGMIRSALSKALKTQYGLPIADKYRIRIEPTNIPNKSEVYLTLTSIGEVISGSSRVWQPREKDIELETEMLLKLMVFIGSDRLEAINQLESKIDGNIANVSVFKSENGFATIVFPYNKKQSWTYLGWVLDELDVDIEDRDPVEASYFISVEPNKGFFSKILSSLSSAQTFQLIIREVDEIQTEVIFVDISEDYNQDTIDYSFKLFNQIVSKF